MALRLSHQRWRAAVNERIRRLGWLGLWLVAKHGLRVWLAEPVSWG